MRIAMAAGVLLGLLAAAPAGAQVLGPRPGYSNATMKPELKRQKMEAAQRQAAQQAAAQQAAEQAARNK